MTSLLYLSITLSTTSPILVWLCFWQGRPAQHGADASMAFYSIGGALTAIAGIVESYKTNVVAHLKTLDHNIHSFTAYLPWYATDGTHMKHAAEAINGDLTQTQQLIKNYESIFDAADKVLDRVNTEAKAAAERLPK